MDLTWPIRKERPGWKSTQLLPDGRPRGIVQPAQPSDERVQVGLGKYELAAFWLQRLL